MQLHAEEPAAGPWRPAALTDVVADLVGARPRAVVAVDGRSAGGKSTFAQVLRAQAVADGQSVALVHTDDVAWHHGFFSWADLLLEGILAPYRRGEDVRFTPPAWAPHGREGSIAVPADVDVLIVEGVGAGRREVTEFLDALVWVQSDSALAKERGIDRDVASGVNGDRQQALAFWDEWEREEVPFLADQRPWYRADLVVAGTPPIPLGPGQVAVADPPVQSRT